MKKILCVMMALAIVGCADSSKPKEQIVYEKMKDVTDRSVCEGTTPSSLELWSNAWGINMKSQNSNNRFIVEIPSKDSSYANIIARCSIGGDNISATKSVSIRFDNSKIEFLEAAPLEAKSSSGSFCQFNWPKIKFNYSFKGKCLSLTVDGDPEPGVLVPMSKW